MPKPIAPSRQRTNSTHARLTPSRRRRPRLLRKSVNSPLEKANSYFRQRRHFIHARLTHYSGRADNACTNLLGFFVRYVRTRGIDEAMESAKPPIFALFCAARTCHARLARLTRARGGCFLRGGGINQCTQCVGWRRRDRGEKALLNDFWYFWSRKSTIKEKYLYVSLRANDVRPYSIKP